MIKISIILPTFNSEKFIDKCIKSILKQSYKNYEVIICDNCSTDDTIKIIKKNIKENKKFKIFKRKDHGVADALNFGFGKSKGDILCWLNSDDLYCHEFVLQLVVKQFEKFNYKHYLVGNFINIDIKNNVIKRFYSYIPIFRIKYIFYYNQIFTGSFFFKKEIFKKFKCFDIKNKYAFEYELLIFVLKNYKGIFLNNFLSCFRIVPDALSSNKIKLKNEFKEILKKNKLIFSNSVLFRCISYTYQNIIFYVLIEKIKNIYTNLKKKF